MLWFDKGRVPSGKWPFLRTVRAGLRELEESLMNSVDLTEGHGAITITGCLEAYRQAVLRRVLDLTQAVVASWNAGQIIGSVVCARALLETLATFHSLLSRAQGAANARDWERLGKLVDSYAFSTSPSSRLDRGKQAPESPPPVGKMVKQFIRDAELGDERFWDQICEVSHPNGKQLMAFAGVLKEQRFDAHSSTTPEEESHFQAVYNCLYSCCWLISAMLDFDILREHIRIGESPPADHPLICQKALIEKLVQDVSRMELGLSDP